MRTGRTLSVLVALLALVAFVLAVTPSERTRASACPRVRRPAPRVLTPLDQPLPRDGALLVVEAPRPLVLGSGLDEPDVDDYEPPPTLRLTSEGRVVSLRRETVLLGTLVHYVPEPALTPGTWQLEGTWGPGWATNAERPPALPLTVTVEDSTMPAPPPAPTLQRAYTRTFPRHPGGRDGRRWTQRQQQLAQLRTAVPPHVAAVVGWAGEAVTLYSTLPPEGRRVTLRDMLLGGGACPSWSAVQNGEFERGDRVRLAFVDQWGRASAPSRAVRFR
ncbi:MAG: hypothetical protein H6726_20470 [Sandaracinaceae bacterium]|nr:hypothetical protein [Sandaracinaceae bacterium]